MSPRFDMGKHLSDSLNEMADLHAAGHAMLGHRPSQPSFWFYGLAVDAMGGEKFARTTFTRERLNANAQAMLAEIDLTEHTRWCICNDRDLAGIGECCYSCANDAHGWCSHDCASYVAEIHFERTAVAS